MNAIIPALFIGILAFLAVYDVRYRIVPNKVTYPAIAIALIYSIASANVNAPMSLLGGAILAGLLFAAGLLQKKMGMGDVKLAFLIGLMTGLPEGIIALFCGILLGGLTAIFLLLLRLRQRKDEMPYAPFLAAGAIVMLVAGQPVMSYLLGLI